MAMMVEASPGAETGANADVRVIVRSECPELLSDLRDVRGIIYSEVYEKIPNSKTGRDIKRRLNPDREDARKTIGIMRATFGDGKTQNIVAISGQGADEWSGKPVKIGNKLFKPVADRLKSDIIWAPLTYKHPEYAKLPPGEPISPEHWWAFAKEYIMRLDNKVKALRKAKLTHEQLTSALKPAEHPRGRTQKDFDDLVSYYEGFCRNDEYLKNACEVIKAFFQAPDPVKYCQSQVSHLPGDAMFKIMGAKIREDIIVTVVQDVIRRDTAPPEVHAPCCVLVYCALGIVDPATLWDIEAPDPVEYCRTLATHLLGDVAYREMETRIRRGGCNVVRDFVETYTAPVELSESCYTQILIALALIDPAPFDPNPIEYYRKEAAGLLSNAVFKNMGARICEGIKKLVQDVYIRHIVVPLKINKEGLVPIYIALGLIDPAELIPLANMMIVEYCRTWATSLLGEAVFREIENRTRKDRVHIAQDIVRSIQPGVLRYTLTLGIVDPSRTPEHCRTQASCFLGDAVFRKIKAIIMKGKNKVIQDVFMKYLKPLGIPEVLLTTIAIALGVREPPIFATAADLTARCAEDNALECLIEICKNNKRRVTKIEWFSASLDLSARSRPLTHKPLCPFCAVAFKPRAEQINMMTSE